MKCKKCGYEIEKPNQRTCPCCGQAVEYEETVQQLEQPASYTEESNSQERIDHLSQETTKTDSVKGCPRCGTVLNGANFCPNCGYDMREMAEIDKIDVPEEPQPESQSYTEESYTPPVEEESIGFSEPEEPVQIPPRQQSRSNYAQDDRPQSQEYAAPYDREADVSVDPNHGYDTAIIEDDGHSLEPSSSSNSSWLVFVLVGIGSILLGCLLYFVV